jgi:phytoene dehydrogenase-like protein
MLNTFIDANLLISAQVTAAHANALYGSAALDLPRRGVNHVVGGIGSIAETLVNWIRQHGGTVMYKQTVERIDVVNGHATTVHTNSQRRNRNSQRSFTFDYLLANQTPWGLCKLLGEAAPQRLQREVAQRAPTWGAFMLYLGINQAKLPPDVASHHQVVLDHTKPLGETNSIFLSMSDPADDTRAPIGFRAANISTHTQIQPWWQLRNDPTRKTEYHERRDQYIAQMLTAAERAVPGFKDAVELLLPATPVTYEQWTGRPQGMVGGFPQESILKARGPGTGLGNTWLVGDSVFPGQSTAGVTLSGLRVARAVMHASRQRHPRRLYTLKRTLEST